MTSSEICSTRCALTDVDANALVSTSEDAITSVVNGDCLVRVTKDVSPNLTSFGRTNEHAVLSSTSDAHDDGAAISSVPGTVTNPTNRSSTLKVVGLFTVGKEFAAEDKSGQFTLASCGRGVRSLDSVEISPEDTRQAFATQEHHCIGQRLEVRRDWSFDSLAWLSVMAGYESLCVLVSDRALPEI
jgi:hypothetical protein